ncbi:MAG: hypothetical protein JNJ69_01060 [Leptospiraceae bacterium]|nr:hypothetical protein [Leptospiraceae bacterium]
MKQKMFIFKAVICALLLVSACTGNKYDGAINGALGYLNARGEKLTPVAIPVIENLKKKFSISIETTAAQKRALQNLSAEQRVFFRHMDSRFMVSREQVRQLRGINHITAAALYCDVYGLPPYFFRSLRKMANDGNYALTHALLALVIIRGQQCSYDRNIYQRELNTQIRQLRQLMRATAPDSDLGIEAILMLHLANRSPERAGEPSFVNPEWIEKIIGSQSPDGSWYQNDHTTVIALWLLLELRSAD